MIRRDRNLENLCVFMSCTTPLSLRLIRISSYPAILWLETEPRRKQSHLAGSYYSRRFAAPLLKPPTCNHCSTNKSDIATFPLYFHTQFLVCIGTAVEAYTSKHAHSESSRSQAQLVISTKRAKQHTSPGGKLSAPLAHLTNTFAILRTSPSTNLSVHSWPLLEHRPLRLLFRTLYLGSISTRTATLRAATTRTAATHTATSRTRRPSHTATGRPPPAARETTSRHTHPQAASSSIVHGATDTTTIPAFNEQKQHLLAHPACSQPASETTSPEMSR